jgi:hypothetical protein
MSLHPLSRINSCCKETVSQERTRHASWAFNLLFAFDAATAGIILAAFTLFLAGHISKDTMATISVGGLGSNAVGKRYSQLYRETHDRLDKTLTKKSENQLDKPNSESEVNCLESCEDQDSETDSSEEANEDTLTTALEKIEQAILSDRRNG